MERDIAVRVENLSKIYKLYDNAIDRLKESINIFGKKYHREFYALENVSFEILKGETVGIIGKNGSGKSTLLKIITGVLTPSAGLVDLAGKISALLELGTGFNPELTGIENIYLNGTILGYTKEEVDIKLDDILAFADIGDFVFQPVKTYSSGMFVRLAFAVAINVDPEILIVDEALSVGDIRFQQKCFRKIEEFSENKTVLFVTHDLSIVNRFCKRAIWLNEGKIQGDGAPDEITKQYQAFMIDSSLTKYEKNLYEPDTGDLIEDIDPIDEGLDVLGDNKALILGVAIFDANANQKVTLVYPGQLIRLFIKVKFNAHITNPIVGFTMKDRLGSIIAQTNSYVLEGETTDCEKNQTVSYCFEFVFPNLKEGFYSISPAVASGTQHDHVQHSWVHDALVLQVLNKQKYQLQGYMFLDNIKFGVMK